MDLKKVDLNELQDYAFTANEIAMSGMTSRNSKFINIKCLDNESITPDRIKQAREEIIATHDSTLAIIEILDNLIAESEGE